ncbi:MAG TPA: hypothetical protein VIY26_14770, partial [Acidimicrobiales bacterium]
NFRWLVGDIATPTEFLVYGIGGLVVPLGLLFLWLRRRRFRPATAPATVQQAGGRPGAAKSADGW